MGQTDYVFVNVRQSTQTKENPQKRVFLWPEYRKTLTPQGCAGQAGAGGDTGP